LHGLVEFDLIRHLRYYSPNASALKEVDVQKE